MLYSGSFKLACTKYKKSYCTNPGVGDGVGGRDGIGVSKNVKFCVKNFKILYEYF